MKISVRSFLAVGALAFGASGLFPSAWSAEEAVVIPAPARDASSAQGLQKAILAGGCFWGLQGVFQHTKGVVNAVSGYAGGSRATANYTAVSSGMTSHAEAVEVSYDPKEISYGKILQIYFSVAHDPTQLNRQGPDVGAQYRSEVFAGSDEQKQIAEAYIAQLDGAKAYPKQIATKVSRLDAFYPAEAYHQDYMTLHPKQPYIAYNDLPKIENLKRIFAQHYRDKPALVSEAKASN